MIFVLVFKSPSFYLITAPQRKSSDAGHSDMSKRTWKMLPLSEKVKVLNKERKKKSCAEVAKFCGKSKFSICEIVKKEK